MNEQQALEKMIAPGTRRPGKYRQGVIQIWVTRHCDKSCFGCTQGSNLRHNTVIKHNKANGEVVEFQQFITPNQFEQAVLSLRKYFGVVGVFGGNPAIHPQFSQLCEIMRTHIPFNQRGIWSNNPITLANAQEMARTFDPSVSNLNVHLDRKAYDLFKQGWPQCHPVGLTEDSRHSPPYVAMKDVVTKPCPTCHCEGDPAEGSGMTAVEAERAYNEAQPEPMSSEEIDRMVKYATGPCPTCNATGKVPDTERIWELISDCDINKHWSAMIGVFRGELRAWFCEIAAAQALLHQYEPDYPDTGFPLDVADNPEWGSMQGKAWWQLPMSYFAHQVRHHCFDCGIPLRGYGELSQSENGVEQCSKTHESIYKPKRKDREVQVVTQLQQLGMDRLQDMTKYLQNSHK